MIKLIIRLIFLGAIFLHIVNVYSQNADRELPKSNYILFSEMSMNSLDELSDVFTVLGKDKIYKISFDSETEAKDFLLNSLRQKFSNYKLIYEKDDSFDYKIVFSELNFKTYYSDIKSGNVLGDESFTRELKVTYKYSVLNVNNSNKSVLKTFKDRIKTDNLEYVENGNYTFMKADLPEKTFMSKILVPAVIVALSALAAILFFTIRSK
jgi:hypothetical protein